MTLLLYQWQHQCHYHVSQHTKPPAKVDVPDDDGRFDSNMNMSQGTSTSLNKTANLVSGSNLLLSDHYSNNSLQYDLVIEAHMEEKENVHHGCKAGVDQVQEINADQTECNVSLVPDKISNPVIWDLILAQINKAKPWTRHSLEQISSFPDPDLSLVVVGESGELAPTFIPYLFQEIMLLHIYQNRKYAVQYLTFCWKHAARYFTVFLL